jgi:hypothetical protein
MSHPLLQSITIVLIIMLQILFPITKGQIFSKKRLMMNSHITIHNIYSSYNYLIIFKLYKNMNSEYLFYHFCLELLNFMIIFAK